MPAIGTDVSVGVGAEHRFAMAACKTLSVHIYPNRNFTAGAPAWAHDSDEDSECVTIDLSSTEFIDTLGLVAIAAVAEDAVTQGRAVDLRLPTLLRTRNWLARMHLGQSLQELDIPCNLDSVVESALGDRLLELHRFDSTSPDELAEKVYAILASDNAEEAGELFRSVAEAAANVWEHSGASGGWAALRQKGQGPDRGVEFAVGDCGVGLRASLSKAIPVASDVAAIEHAVQKGVSGTGERNRGLGLAEIAASAQRRDGSLRLFSGRAGGFTLPNGKILARNSLARYPGTLVYATLKFETGR
ncbi:hypothetical protein [Rhodococcus sovatensis]|uniref:STAS domain-containing protein n=1 Tax=Rhodococcus sovatensis TaxID=1805840 RepID=A0ABZ2PNF6_9NOCA